MWPAVDNPGSCWVCGAASWRFLKPSDVGPELSSRQFAITDSHYGITGALNQCRDCGFVQSSELHDVQAFYEQLEDPEYVAGQKERALQAQKLLNLVARFRPGGRLVDVGAGSGILVEQALLRGYDAAGVEPSRWLCEQGRGRSLPLHLGTFPHPDISPGIDVVTLVDVLEHVSDPVGMLQRVREQLADDGVGLVVTPDVSSVAARLLGRRWWHYRIAHIGYFNRQTLVRALRRAGLEPLQVGRPGWYFSLRYLAERIQTYLPFFRVPQLPALDRWTVPLNLRDSLFVVFRKAGGPS